MELRSIQRKPVFICDAHMAFAFRVESMIVIYSRAQDGALSFSPGFQVIGLTKFKKFHSIVKPD